jgi:sugar O-acyltransferase (sialic acid O-acetyltransferase NeuD family)
MKKIIILGAGGNAIDILDIILDINEYKPGTYECIGILDDQKSKLGKRYYDIPVLGSLEVAKKYNDIFFVNGIGNSENFWKKNIILAKTDVVNERFETIIHPRATISRSAKVGYGSVISPNVSIANNVIIGNHVFIYSNSVINHDVAIGDYSIITSGVCISGYSKVDEACYLGTNSAIRQNISIGKHALIGMGSVVLEDIIENTVVVGNPARYIKQTK